MRVGEQAYEAGAAEGEWLRFWDETERRHYFYNVKADATEWELPSGCAWRDGDDESAAHTHSLSQPEAGAPSSTQPHPPLASSSASPTILAEPAAMSATTTALSHHHDLLEPMRMAAREFEAEVAAVADSQTVEVEWLPPDCRRCEAGSACSSQDDVHFVLFAHPRPLLESKGIVPPLHQHPVGIEPGAAADVPLPPPPSYEGVLAMDTAAAPGVPGAGHDVAALRQDEVPRYEDVAAQDAAAAAGRRLAASFGGWERAQVGGAGRGSGGRVSELSGMLDEAARDTQEARACCESGRKQAAVELYRRAESKLENILAAHSSELGAVLREEVQARASDCRSRCAKLADILRKATTLRTHSVRELMDSEVSYKEGLREMQRVYHAQVTADLQSVAPVISRHDEEIVFGRISLLINHSQLLHERLLHAVTQRALTARGSEGSRDAPPGERGSLDVVDDETFERVLAVLQERSASLCARACLCLLRACPAHAATHDPRIRTDTYTD